MKPAKLEGSEELKKEKEEDRQIKAEPGSQSEKAKRIEFKREYTSEGIVRHDK